MQDPEPDPRDSQSDNTDSAPDADLARPTTAEEMRAYYEQCRGMPLVKVGSTWLFGSGN